jgi:hypothetical protein
MTNIPLDDDLFGEAVTKAVRDLLASDTKQLGEIANDYLDDAKSAYRAAVSDIEQSTQLFQSRARAILAEADAAIAQFKVDIDKKKTDVKDALNIKILAGFTVVVIFLTLGAIGYLGDRLSAVHIKDQDVIAEATKLATDAATLQGNIDAANKIYENAFEANKNADAATQMQTLNALTARISSDLLTTQSDVKLLKERTAPIISDWAARHPQTKPAH